MPDTISEAQEHPIIFSEWSINRILAGEKTQTRRTVKPQPASGVNSIRHVKGRFWQANEMGSEWDPTLWQEKCPYGQSGDALWVREAFRLPHTYDEMSPSEYVDEGQPHIVRFEAEEGDYNAVPKDGWGRKRPSIHMPRELCRLRLRVEDVRVERVQDISSEDARAEGVTGKDADEHDSQEHSPGEIYRLALRDLWYSIHGSSAWDGNPWVWVIEFSRIDNA